MGKMLAAGKDTRTQLQILYFREKTSFSAAKLTAELLLDDAQQL